MLSTLIEVAPSLPRRCRQHRRVQPAPTIVQRGQLHGKVQYVQQSARIAIGLGKQLRTGRIGKLHRQVAETALAVVQAAFQNRCERFLPKGLEYVNADPGQESTNQGEAGILCRCPDEGERTFLQVGKQGILLSFVETVDLVDEEHRRLTPPTSLRGHGRRRAQLSNTTVHGGEGEHLGTLLSRQEVCKGRLADSRRSPEDEGVQRLLPQHGGDGPSRTQQPFLADELGEGARAHARRQRPRIATGQCRSLAPTVARASKAAGNGSSKGKGAGLVVAGSHGDATAG